jgi:hypothetical protein
MQQSSCINIEFDNKDEPESTHQLQSAILHECFEY